MSKNNNIKNFNPVIFLMSLGAGGLSIGFWVFLNYAIEHGKGLVTTTQVHQAAETLFQKIFYTTLEVMAVIFALIHVISLFYLMKKFFVWRKTAEYTKYMNDPLKNNGIMAMFLAIDMFFNIAFAIGNHFVLQNGPLFQPVMAPALAGWTVVYLFTMGTSMRILKTSFTKEFDMKKIHFGFMTHPFALAMLAVTGYGIAAFAKTPAIANIAFFLAMAPLLVAILLTIVKVITMFQHHLKNNLPDRNFLPSTFIVMPTIMLIFLSFFRMGHYFEHIFGYHVAETFYIFTTVVPFVFLTWYGIFGLTLIKGHYKDFKKFDVSQWGFICPLVAYSVIGTIANAMWLGGYMPGFYLIIGIVFLTSILYLKLLIRQIKSK